MNKIRDKPERIFNIDETGINTEHSPPRIVCDKSTKPQDISSTRSAAISIIAGGNALGNYLPPYYIFIESFCGFTIFRSGQCFRKP
jgi:hypothetical protein